MIYSMIPFFCKKKAFTRVCVEKYVRRDARQPIKGVISEWWHHE